MAYLLAIKFIFLHVVILVFKKPCLFQRSFLAQTTPRSSGMPLALMTYPRTLSPTL